MKKVAKIVFPESEMAVTMNLIKVLEALSFSGLAERVRGVPGRPRGLRFH